MATSNKTASIATRITPEEKAQYKALALAKGISLSEMMRQAMELIASQPTSVPPQPTVEPEKVEPTLLLAPAPELTPVVIDDDFYNDPMFLCENMKDAEKMIENIEDEILGCITDNMEDCGYTVLLRDVGSEFVESILLGALGHPRKDFESIIQDLEISNAYALTDSEELTKNNLSSDMGFHADLWNEVAYSVSHPQFKLQLATIAKYFDSND